MNDRLKGVWRGRFGHRLLTEAALMYGLFAAYKFVRYLVRDNVGEAFVNARRVISFEQAWGLASEVSFQRLAMHWTPLIFALNRYYITMHFLTTVVYLAWVYVRHYDAYRHVRRLLLVTTLVALAGHVFFPLAPPRMLPIAGFVDTMARYGPNPYNSKDIAATANQFAAMPSVHFAWAVLVAYGVVRFSRSRWRYLAIAHPVVTLTAIVCTANHYWIDAIMGGLLVLGAMGVDTLVGRTTRAPARGSPVTAGASG